MENVIEFGDQGDNFYIILKGVVAIEIPNPNIQDRDIKWKDFQMLKKWKEDDFDPRAADMKEKYMREYQIKDELKKNMEKEIQR